MTILAVEFSAPQRSVAALCRRGAGTVGAEVVDTTERGPELIGLIEKALHQAQIEREQIDCLAIGLGPGSYTGIRSAIAFAQGWELAVGSRPIQFLGISTAECIAAQAQADKLANRVAVVIDAQRGEFYLASYELGADGIRNRQPLGIASGPEVQARQQAGDLLIGPEVTKWFPAGHLVCPRAATLAHLALSRTDFVSAQNLQPIYLRETQFVKAQPPRVLPAG